MNDTIQREPICVPELGIDDAQLTLSVWLVRQGATVALGDRVVEILTGEAIVDLPAPRDGVLVEKVVAEDSSVQVGQIVGWVQRVAPPNV